MESLMVMNEFLLRLRVLKLPYWVSWQFSKFSSLLTQFRLCLGTILHRL